MGKIGEGGERQQERRKKKTTTNELVPSRERGQRLGWKAKKKKIDGYLKAREGVILEKPTFSTVNSSVAVV